MRHENVVKFCKFFEDVENVFIVMENCGGLVSSLSQISVVSTICVCCSLCVVGGGFVSTSTVVKANCIHTLVNSLSVCYIMWVGVWLNNEIVAAQSYL